MSEKDEKEYTKQQFIASKHYTAGQKDLLSALLEEGKTYTHSQVKHVIKSFLEMEAR